LPGNFTPSLYLLFYHNIQPKETLLLQNIAKEIVAISIDRIGGISNIIKRPHHEISDENTDRNSVQKMWNF
jgi:hypothetical protein